MEERLKALRALLLTLLVVLLLLGAAAGASGHGSAFLFGYGALLATVGLVSTEAFGPLAVRRAPWVRAASRVVFAPLAIVALVVGFYLLAALVA